MASIENVSLKGLQEYAHKKNSSESNSYLTSEHKHLRDLESLLNKMYNIREQNTKNGCSSHGDLGNESRSSCPSVSTPVCNSHANNKGLYTNKLSLGAFRDALSTITSCTCDSRVITGCECVSYCPCVSRCGCQSRCSCNCNQSG